MSKNYTTYFDYMLNGFKSYIVPTNNDLETKSQHFILSIYDKLQHGDIDTNIPKDKLHAGEFNNKSRLKARKIIRDIVLDTIYQIFAKAELENNTLLLNEDTFLRLCSSKNSKLKDELGLKHLLIQLGFIIKSKNNYFVISTQNHDGCLELLQKYAKYCSGKKRLGLRGFYNFDFEHLVTSKISLHKAIRFLNSSFKLVFNDFHNSIISSKLKFKIELYEDFGYRIAYYNKLGVVYYVYINAYKLEQYYHYGRWVLDSEKTQSLIEDMLNSNDKELLQYLSSNFNYCDPNCTPGYGAESIEQCGARVRINIHNKTNYICKDKGFSSGYEDSDFDKIQRIIAYVHKSSS